MHKYRSYIVTLMAMLILALPSLGAVITAATVPATRVTGEVITAAIWNADALGIYSYINSTLVPVLNTLTTKGDLYVYTGAALARQGVGSNDQVLTADSTLANGIKWAAFANNTQLTTKGDILGYSSSAVRVPVGTNGQVLIADSTQAAGIKWGTPSTSIPSGTIVAWSPAYAGTNTIPTGWLLCDGTSSTPNLIGKFIVGTRPSGSTATPATGGFGAQTVDTAGAGVAAHTHTYSTTVLSAGPTTNVNCNSGGNPVAGPTHTHSFTISGTTGSTSSEPSDYALVYIMKQ